MIDEEKSHEAGMTLIELIIGIVVSTIVLAAVATVLVNAFITQNSVMSTSEATNRGQLVGSAIEKAMRNAVYSAVSPDGTVLRVQTTFDAVGDVRHCQAFRLADKTAQLASSDASVATPSWGTWLDGDAARAWTVFVRQDGATAFFTPLDPTAANGGVSYVFDIETDSAPVTFRGEVHPEWQPDTGGVPKTCW